LGATAPLLDLPRDEFTVGACVDEKLGGLPLPRLVQLALAGPQENARDMREHIGAPGGELDDLCCGGGFLLRRQHPPALPAVYRYEVPPGHPGAEGLAGDPAPAP